MRTFTSKKVETAFEELAKGKVDVNHGELAQGKFNTYDEFERHQSQTRKPIWMDALLKVSGCKKRESPEEQWSLFGKIFRRFHGNHMEWLTDPQSCPFDIREAREAALENVIESFAENKKCHWKRDHQFFCFCN